MKAAVLYKLGAPLAIETDVELPQLARGQVLVKLAFSGVCHSQLMEVKGCRGEDRFLPHLLGHEGSGVVEAIGEGVTKVKPQDHVVLGWVKGSGIDAGGVKYFCKGRTLNAGAVTTFNDVAIVSENRCTKIDSNFPLDIAPLFGCAFLTGAGLVLHELGPDPRGEIAIFGLGGIGMSALMATQLLKFDRVIAVDTENSKLEHALSWGATHIINAKREDAVEAIHELTSGRGLDYVIESAGLSQTIEQAFKSVRRHGGLCVFASHPKNGDHISLDPFELICGKRIKGSWGGGANPDNDIPRFIQLYRSGQLPLESLVAQRYCLDEIDLALADLEAKRVLRPLIELDPNV